MHEQVGFLEQRTIDIEDRNSIAVAGPLRFRQLFRAIGFKHLRARFGCPARDSDQFVDSFW
jgi:hypothetical protein